MMLSFKVLKVAPNRRIPTRFPENVFALISLAIVSPLSMIALVALFRNALSLIVFLLLPALKVDPFGVSVEFVVVDQNPRST